MMRTAKTNIYDHYTHFADQEFYRLNLHSMCPETTPQSCEELGLCWDGSARDIDWPDCSCVDFDPLAYPCPDHDCSDAHGHNDMTC